MQNGEYTLFGTNHEPNHPNRELEIEALRHACLKLKPEVREKEVLCAGELMVRAIPADKLGTLEVYVKMEKGVSIDGGFIHMGRQYAYSGNEYPLPPDGYCMIDAIGAGTCEVYADARDKYNSARQRVQINPGQTTSVELKAYGERRVVFEWKYRRPAGEGEWQMGTTEILTGESAPRDIWDYRASVFKLSHCDESGASIRGMNGKLIPAKPGDFDAPPTETNAAQFKSEGYKPFPLAVGNVFALRYGRTSKDEGEAFLRVRRIEPPLPGTR